MYINSKLLNRSSLVSYQFTGGSMVLKLVVIKKKKKLTRFLKSPSIVWETLHWTEKKLTRFLKSPSIVWETLHWTTSKCTNRSGTSCGRYYHHKILMLIWTLNPLVRQRFHHADFNYKTILSYKWLTVVVTFLLFNQAFFMQWIHAEVSIIWINTFPEQHI